MKKKFVVLTGAGISAESGIRTFRDSNGLWEGHDVMEVASPEGWHKNRDLVLDFYNQRRKQAREVQPNRAHYILAEMEEDYDMTIVTQNVDDLHERAGSTKVIHLHGELSKAQSTVDHRLVYDLEHWEMKIGDTCKKGSQLRPFIVWFGEMVPKMEEAIHAAQQAEIFAVVGTSLLVYPAAGLSEYTSRDIPKYIIDKQIPNSPLTKYFHAIEGNASTGMQELKDLLASE